MRYKSLLFLLFLFEVNGLAAQIRLPNSEAFSEKPKIIFGLDGRFTKVYGQGVQLGGVRAGLDWANIYRAGIGYYWLMNKVYLPYNDGRQAHNAKLYIRYAAPFAEFTFYENERWQLNTQVQAGFGGKFLRYSSGGTSYDKDIGVIILGDIGLSGHFKLLDWIGLSGGVGYRQMLLPKLLNTEGLSAPYVSLNVKFFPASLLETVQQNKPVVY